MRHQILQHGIGDIADKQIALAMLGLEELSIRIRGFRYHPPIFGVLSMKSRDSGF